MFEAAKTVCHQVIINKIIQVCNAYTLVCKRYTLFLFRLKDVVCLQHENEITII